MEVNGSPSDLMKSLLDQESTSYLTCEYAVMNSVASEKLGKRGKVSSDEPTNESSRFGRKKRKVTSLAKTSSMECHNFKEEDAKKHSQETEEDEAMIDESKRKQVWRQKIVEWAYSVVDHFDLDREITVIAMNYVDRSYSSSEGTNEHETDIEKLQLVAMTCLYLSIKLYEFKHIFVPGSKSSMETILKLGRGHHTLEEMERMELEILDRLEWHVHPPTPQNFIHQYFSDFSCRDDHVFELANFMVELSVMDYFFVAYKPSEVALGALLCAMERLFTHSNHELNFKFLTHLRSMQTDRVLACRERLTEIYINSIVEPTTPAPNSQDHAEEYRTSSPVSVMGTFIG